MFRTETWSYGLVMKLPWCLPAVIAFAIAAGVVVLWLVLRRRARGR
jgi:hypothetical protein